MYDWSMFGKIEYEERLRRVQSRSRQPQLVWQAMPDVHLGRRLRNAFKALIKYLKHNLVQVRTRAEERAGEQTQASMG